MFLRSPRKFQQINLHSGLTDLQKQLLNKQKQQLYSTFRYTHLSSDYVVYTHKRNEVKSQIRFAQASHEQQLIDKFQTNPKALYGYMRNKLGYKPRIGHITKTDGSLTESDGKTAAEVFSNFFQSVFTSKISTTEIFLIVLVSCLT